MPLLPSSVKSFANTDFWESFYRQHVAPFEWYGDFNDLGDVLERYLKPSDHILQIGCGNSKLATELYDNGYQNLWNIDTDKSSIEKQVAENCKGRATLSFQCASAEQLPFTDGSMNVVLDKGFLDAILPPPEKELPLKSDDELSNIIQTNNNIQLIFDEISRVLVNNAGRYIVVSLAQSHILHHFLYYFSTSVVIFDADFIPFLCRGFMIRIQIVEQKNDSTNTFFMPVVFLIATKLRFQLPTKMIELVRNNKDKAERFTSIKSVCDEIMAVQEFAHFCHLCRRKLTNEINIRLVDGQNGKDKYEIWLIDDQEMNCTSRSKFASYAAFIVPLGREDEWLFCTEKGRMQLRKQCDKSRLAVVLLFRDQIYDNLEMIQNDLNDIILKFAPPQLKNSRIDYLSLGKVNVLKELSRGQSKISGEWSVEDVNLGDAGSRYRRLVFLTSKNVIQSECKLIANKTSGGWMVDLDSLSCAHHEAMLTAFAFIDADKKASCDQQRLRIAVLGLGGGLLVSFLYRHFTKASITAVELDEEVLKIANRWFALPSTENNKRLLVVIDDALHFLDQTKEDVKAHKMEPFDVLLVDLAGAVHEPDLSCPPREFLSDTALSGMSEILSDNGVMALNLVTRDADVSAIAKRQVRQYFPRIYVHSSDEDINEVIIIILF
ncbi:unnamed protein product [Anisakis simplex]|uniref:Methyltransferase-like protein 13 (inferred by orthology to a human protein) n=1 Tax=Anisakis simplex TaxID=6269 RepID=A0A0M3JT49_ANISI|nr:unnamed protein product [Anisakis simplex]